MKPWRLHSNVLFVLLLNMVHYPKDRGPASSLNWDQLHRVQRSALFCDAVVRRVTSSLRISNLKLHEMETVVVRSCNKKKMHWNLGGLPLSVDAMYFSSFARDLFSSRSLLSKEQWSMSLVLWGISVCGKPRNLIDKRKTVVVFEGAVSPIIPSAPKYSSRHFIFHWKYVCFE